MDTNTTLSFSCEDYNTTGTICYPGMVAYSQTTGGPDNDIPVMTLCPEFWARDYLSVVGAASDLIPSDLGDLNSYENTILHELMHFDGPGFEPQISDVEIPNPPDGDDGYVYGAEKCHNLAWMLASDTATTKYINTNVSINAENYAFFFTSVWASHHHNWTQYDGKHDLKNITAG